MNASDYKSFADKITDSCSKVILGKNDVIRQVIICFLCGGHVLLEDVPGTGKTMLLRAFAKSIGADFKRVQFTPDLLPSDLTGINFYNQKQGEFEFRRGPIFTNMLLADEINRATPRTQSALLEAMEERQVSIDGTTYPLTEPFMVMATENPIESYGTFPLPEAQLDRFFMKLSMGYMPFDEEIKVISRPSSVSVVEGLTPVTTLDEITALKSGLSTIRVSDDIAGYILKIITATRNNQSISVGASTRGGIALYKASQAMAAISGRDYVIPEDVKQEAAFIIPHRLCGIFGKSTDLTGVFSDLLAEIQVPLEAN